MFNLSGAAYESSFMQCIIHLIHLIGRKSLHFEKKTNKYNDGLVLYFLLFCIVECCNYSKFKVEFHKKFSKCNCFDKNQN